MYRKNVVCNCNPSLLIHHSSTKFICGNQQKCFKYTKLVKCILILSILKLDTDIARPIVLWENILANSG
uniref:Uncharacterized protein n=1 Tax=Anguilla anguilla TaxID=7936 RepID=A0A0E9TQU1_ANGAN